MQIHRGTNISHFLSQSKKRGEERRAYITRDDIQRIAGWGFDHIRLPIDEEQMWTEDGSRENEAFDLLGLALDWSAEAGMKTVVDLHILRSHYFNDKTQEPPLFTDPAEMEKFADLWRDLSAFMNERPNDNVAYELLNESVASDPEDWNRVAHHAFNAVRQLEPERTIILGSNKWCQTQTFPDLRIPDDDHMILTFHYYNPMLITHYQARWTALYPYTGPIQYPGYTAPDKAAVVAALGDDAEEAYAYHDRMVMMEQIKVAYDVADGRPLYCGEFGVHHTVPLDTRLAWYRDLIEVFDELGIAWANWDYKGGFGLITPNGAETGILQALIPA